MPLRFRSVVPYTLPGILALIGWWWYISRKKERLICQDGPEGAAAAAAAGHLRSSPAEGSNGLVEKGSVSPTENTGSPTHRPAKVGSQREHEDISHLQVQHSEAAPPQDAAAPQIGRITTEEVQKWSSEDGLQISQNAQTGTERSSPALEERLVEEVVSAQQSTKVGSSFPTAAPPSEAQRPEPEGEVAKHHGGGGTAAQEEASDFTVTPGKDWRTSASEISAAEMPLLELHQHVVTSTPNAAPESAASDIQLHRGAPDEQEERDLELLAAGLITEVISAATQEVLGVTGCQAADIGGGGRIQPLQEPVASAQQHLLAGRDCIETPEKVEPAMPNGCSSASIWEPLEASRRLHQTHDAQRGHWPVASPLSRTAALKGDESAALAEDSACSTCHSEDGLSSEDLQSSVFHSQSGIQVSHLAERDAAGPQSLVEGITEAAVLAAAAVAADDSAEAACELKRLNGMGLRNGAHGTSEAETDQSGGSDVNSMDSVDSGCTMGVESQGNHAASSSSELIVWEIEVPKHLVGRLIGKQGRYVSFLKQNSGAKIYISTLPYTQEFQICHIEGTQQQVDKALALIGKKFKDLDLTNLYAPPPLSLPSLPITSWLLLPSGVTVEVIVVNIVSAGHVFVQQHTHPTYHALRSLDQQMFLCYSQQGTPALPSPAEVGVICAAPAVEGAWWRAQVISFYSESNEVEIRYVDYGGYDRVKIDTLRQISLPITACAEVLLDNIAPLPGEDRFSAEATSALEEMTRGAALLAQVSNYDNNTGLPLVHLWNMVGEEVISVNRTLAERGLGVWVDGF
uniref:Tudor domain-containing protein n=1 Tax=Salarias fasciatus TaxID=181472 RepID=A0A672HD22_SALFA